MDKPLTIEKHLTELKKRIYWVIIPMFFLFIFFLVVSNFIILKLLSFYDIETYVLSPLEYINTQINLSFYLTIISIIPLALVQLYIFAKPITNKKINIKKNIFFSVLLMVLGVLFGLLIFSKFTLNFLNNYSMNSLWGIGSTFNLILVSALSFGAIFQIAVIIPFLDKTELIKAEFFKNKRKYVFLSILIISAIITPTTDMFTMLIMALPSYSIFELGLIITKLNRRLK